MFLELIHSQRCGLTELCPHAATDATIDLPIDLISVVCVSVQMSPVGVVVCSVFRRGVCSPPVWTSADIDYGSERED